MTTTANRILYLVCCAAAPAVRVADGVRAAQDAGWDVCLILTPYAHRWLEADVPALRELTGHPVRHEYKLPGQPDVLPPPDAILVAPATFNTLNKWAAGISDTLALGLVTEAIGLGLPMAALPHLGAAQAAHPALSRSVDFLRAAGVTVLLGEDGYDPGRGDRVETYPWERGVAALAGA
ncbi:flavoprotein [Streptomyces cinnamoneus]|uniref:Flavoprotein n=1 Tax=Streptomyces cinnamoneus TaxID=53446 RepID=A0A2G1XIN4_STRCJ|nr:flavoprotein [Streptomyces cinnamoneus]PHQ51083.1 flavoprotein [Streptomyces cinnamoneus]PPT13694.1 flavoprotein [Streptomyces cinnamoneus]